MTAQARIEMREWARLAIQLTLIIVGGVLAVSDLRTRLAVLANSQEALTEEIRTGFTRHEARILDLERRAQARRNEATP